MRVRNKTSDLCQLCYDGLSIANGGLFRNFHCHFSIITKPSGVDSYTHPSKQQVINMHGGFFFTWNPHIDMIAVSRSLENAIHHAASNCEFSTNL